MRQSDRVSIAVGISYAFKLRLIVPHTLQVFRTEHYCHALNPKSVLPLTAVIIYTIAAISLVSAVATHTGDIQQLLSHPITCGSCWLSQAQSLPWTAIVFTGLLSTDLALYIEVRLKPNVN